MDLRPHPAVRRLLWIPLLCSALPAQDAEMSTRDEPVVFRSSSNLVLAPVVVRDRQGHSVIGLKKEDFRLTDSGKPQVISRFSVELRNREGAPAAAPAPNQPDTIFIEAPAEGTPERYIAYVFDDIHTGASELIQARQAALRHMSRSLGPGDRAAIFTTSGSNTLDFTGDQLEIQRALDRLIPGLVVDYTTCSQTSYAVADAVENRRDEEARQFLISKVMACNSDNDEAMATRMANIMVKRALATGDEQSRTSLRVIDEAIRRLSIAPGERAVVLVSQGFLARDLRYERSGLMERAIHARTTISAVDARGLYTLAPDASRPTQLTSALAIVERRIELQEMSDRTDVMGELADGTGGFFFHNNNDLLEGFNRAASRPDALYVLAFSPQNLRYDGSFHNIKVTVAGPGYEIQARRGYYAPKHLNDAQEQAREEIREAVFSRDELRDIPLDVRTQFFKPDELSATMTVVVRVDPKQLKFRKQEERNHDVLTIVAAVFDRDGRWIAGNEKTLTMRLRDETVAARLEAGLSLRSSFEVTPGLYQVRVVIRDSEGQMMAARNAGVDIP
jgi:VWFA-related protein